VDTRRPRLGELQGAGMNVQQLMFLLNLIFLGIQVTLLTGSIRRHRPDWCIGISAAATFSAAVLAARSGWLI
jgi:hypothetical protein